MTLGIRGLLVSLMSFRVSQCPIMRLTHLALGAEPVNEPGAELSALGNAVQEGDRVVALHQNGQLDVDALEHNGALKVLCAGDAAGKVIDDPNGMGADVTIALNDKGTEIRTFTKIGRILVDFELGPVLSSRTALACSIGEGVELDGRDDRDVDSHAATPRAVLEGEQIGVFLDKYIY